MVKAKKRSGSAQTSALASSAATNASTSPTRAASEAALRNVAEWLDDRPARDGEMRFGWETWEDPFFDDADSRLDVL